MAWTVCMSDADISTLTTAYTVPAGVEARLTAAFCNRSTSATATVSLWVVPQGETRGNEHLKESGTTLGLAGTSQAVLERSFVAPTGCIVYVQASTANVSCQVQGDVVSTETTVDTDYTSSIVYSTNWSEYVSGSTSLKVSQNGLVTLYLSATHAGGTESGYSVTLPSAARPTKNRYVPLIGYGSSQYVPAFAIINTSGQVVHSLMASSPISSLTGPDSFVWVNASYYI